MKCGKICVRLLAVLTALMLLFAIPMWAMAAQEQAVDYSHSGDLDREKPTKEQIIDAWHQVSVYDSYFAEEPSVTAPYATGALSENFLESGLSYLNYIRYVAGLPSVQLSKSMTENAQYGAVVLAAIDTLTHYPSQPADMPDDFYNQGYQATTSSNISMRSGYGDINFLQSSLSGCLADDGSNNLATLGHRRWLLNPDLLNVGFGFAKSVNGSAYVTTKIFDWSAAPINYEFVSWPASGYVPDNLFDADDPWSVTLNPGLYQRPVLANVTVTLTRESDGQQWTFDANTGGPTTSQYPYMLVDTQGYGVSNCLIFSPGSAAIGAYDGVYTVNIQGLYTVDGEQTELSYQVEFFEIGPCQHVYSEKKVEATCVSYGYTVRTCKICGEYSYGDYVWDGPHSWGSWVVDREPDYLENGKKSRTCSSCGETETEVISNNPFPDVGLNHSFKKYILWGYYEGIISGDKQGSFNPDNTVTRGQFMLMLWRAAGKPEPTKFESFPDVTENSTFYKAVCWAAEKGITNGQKDGTFGVNDPCTRGHVVLFLYRYTGQPKVKGTVSFPDVTGGTYYKAVCWAAENGITSGQSDGNFGVVNACKRMHVMKFLYLFMN